MKALLYALAALGAGLVALGAWFRHRAHRREALALDLQLAIHRDALDAKRFGQVLDESLQSRARARREIADSIRKRSAMVASGSSSTSVLRIARKA